MTMKNESQNSVVVFLPRLARDGETKITTTIIGPVNASNSNVTGLPDYGNGPAKYYYIHPNPFSIIATYDGGSNLFIPSAFFTDKHQYFDIGNLIILIPIVLGFLAFAIGFRHRRKSPTKFIFNVLNDIKEAKKELIKDVTSTEIIYNIKYDQVKQFFKNYRDYQIIWSFYKSLERRDASLSKNPSVEWLLKKQNKECLVQAQEAYSKINWRKFYKFDLLTGVPAIIIGSIVLTFVAEGVSYFLLWGYGINWLISPSERIDLFPYFTITTFIIRSISGFFIVGAILHTTQGIRDYFKYPFSRPITLLVLSIVILGVPTMTIVLLMENERLIENGQLKIDSTTTTTKDRLNNEIPLVQHIYRFPLVQDVYGLVKPAFIFIFSESNSQYRFYLTAMVILFDIARMFLMTWASWTFLKWYTNVEATKSTSAIRRRI